MLIVPKLIILKSIFPMLAFLIVWDMVWKWIALYKAWSQKEIWRFICLFIFNTCGLLPIIYLLIDCTKNDNIETYKKNTKISSETKQSKTTMKGGGLKWENAMPVKRQKGTLKDSWRKKTVNTLKK